MIIKTKCQDEPKQLSAKDLKTGDVFRYKVGGLQGKALYMKLSKFGMNGDNMILNLATGEQYRNNLDLEVFAVYPKATILEEGC